MFDDARSIAKDSEIETDLCIVGAGAAGITLARELASESFKVCLLESGASEIEEDVQALNAGGNLGLPYFPLITTRLRFFGGTTNHWAGESRPLDPIDFETRDWIPNSGWPITREVLDPYYERAQRICKLGAFDYRPERWPPRATNALNMKDERVVTTIYQQNPPVRFGKAYGGDLRAAKNLRVMVHANVVDMEASEDGSSIKRLRVACLTGNRFWIRAKRYVLALGAIETTRLMMLSRVGRQRGYGGKQSPVGRYFSEHPYVEIGMLKPSKPWVGSQLIERATEQVDGVGIIRAFTFTEETLRKERLPSFQVFLENVPAPGTASLRKILWSIRRGEFPDDLGHHLGNVMQDFDDVSWEAAKRPASARPTPVDAIRVSVTFEPVPDPNSRVKLLKVRDALGQHRVGLDWQVDPAQKASLRRIARIVGAAFASSGLGRFRMTLNHNDAEWQTLPKGSWHQLGSTRMHADPKRGVVDSQCKVHGLANLYIASGSVFPTVGYANPTLSIVALTLRLAEELKKKFK